MKIAKKTVAKGKTNYADSDLTIDPTGRPLKECLKCDREVHYIWKNKLSSPTTIISTKGSKFYQDKISLLIVYVI